MKFSETRTEPERDATLQKRSGQQSPRNVIVGLCSHPSRARARALLRALVCGFDFPCAVTRGRPTRLGLAANDVRWFVGTCTVLVTRHGMAIVASDNTALACLSLVPCQLRRHCHVRMPSCRCALPFILIPSRLKICRPKPGFLSVDAIPRHSG